MQNKLTELAKTSCTKQIIARSPRRKITQNVNSNAALSTQCNRFFGCILACVKSVKMSLTQLGQVLANECYGIKISTQIAVGPPCPTPRWRRHTGASTMSALLSQFQCRVWSQRRVRKPFPIPYIERDRENEWWRHAIKEWTKSKNMIYDLCPIIFKAKLCSKNVNTFFPSFFPPAGHLLRVLQDVDFAATSDQIIRVQFLCSFFGYLALLQPSQRGARSSTIQDMGMVYIPQHAYKIRRLQSQLSSFVAKPQGTWQVTNDIPWSSYSIT